MRKPLSNKPLSNKPLSNKPLLQSQNGTPLGCPVSLPMTPDDRSAAAAGYVRYDTLPPGALRAKLLTFAAEFVVRARALPGVERIALIGSILTPKTDPKDIDFLLTVSDACNLEPLAIFARRMAGRAQGLNHGAEVCLTSSGGEYLGRVCRWRECRPGIRASCDAAHCGRRPHLHDDFGDVRLPQPLLREPPVELWPTLIIRTPLPPDVQTWIDDMSRWAA